MQDTESKTDDQPISAVSNSADQNNQISIDESFPFAIMGGLLATLVSAIIWAAITVLTEHQIGWVAIGVGFLVGIAVRFFGRGTTNRYGIAGAALSFIGCLGGNFISIIGFIAKENSLNLFQVLFTADYGYIVASFPQTMSPMDLVFYFLAIYEGYRFSIIPAVKNGETAVNTQIGLLDPSLAKYRMPILIGGGVIVLGGFYGVQFLSSGPVTNYYDSGIIQSTGVMKSGKPDGIWTYYDEKGVISCTLTYSTGELSGRAAWWNDKKVLLKEGSYWNGLEHGDWKFYDTNGIMTSAGSYKYGREEGRWDYYYTRDKKSAQVFYAAGMYDSIYTSWYKNGTIEEEGAYKEGLKYGTWKQYDSTGLLTYESRFSADTEFIVYATDRKNKPMIVNGKGEYKTFFDNEKIQQQGFVNNFCRTGIWKSFYENGAPEMVVFWSDNKKKIINYWKMDGSLIVTNGNGTYALTTENDSLLIKGDYKDSLKSGEWNYYYDDGTLYRRFTYENNLLNGPAKLYYESGKPLCEGVHKNDLREGEWIWYHESGIVSSKVTYSNDKKHGLQLHYNRDGKKIREENYENGKLVSEKDFI